MGDQVDLSIGQIRDAWRVMCADSPRFAAATDGGIDYVFSGVPIGFFNVAVLTGRGITRDALDGQARRACEWAADKGVPWLFILTHEGLAPGVDATAVLDGCGLAPMIPLTGMIAEQVAPVSRVPEGLRLTVPEEDAGCAAMLDINSSAYGVDLAAAKPLIGIRDFWTRHVPVLGEADGAPASCAAVLMVDGYRYVALVATDPSRQRRGFAEVTMRHALGVAARSYGERPTVLHATDAGRPIYARMGYSTVSSHVCFMEKRFLEGH